MIIYKEFSIEKLEEVKEIYSSEEWYAYLNDDEKLKRAFNNSIYILGAFNNDKLIGFVRCLGDGEHFVIIQDLIILKDFQRKGIGTKLFKLASDKYKDVRMFQVITDLNDRRDNAFYKKMGMRVLIEGNMISYHR